jgi:hypothetical protein
MDDRKTYFLMAGIIFTLVALFHLVRIYMEWPVIIGDWSVPKWARERAYRLFPDLRDSNANTFRTSDWEIPNCLAMREGAIPALKVASTAFT